MADVITRLRVESSEYDNKIKRAAESLQAYATKCRQVGGTLEKLDECVLEYVRDLGKMETVNKTARGGISELTKAFTDLRIQYNQLTQAEKQSPFGKALKSSLDELKVRIQAGKKELNDISQELSGSKFGQFGSIIDGIGRKMGVNANLTELLTSRTALLTAGLGATIAAVTKGTEEWAKYNQELARQDEFTAVTTGLKGIEANDMTDKMRALTDTYKVNFNDSIQAANTLMTQFGISGSEAISLIKDGMQGMIRGDGQKLLSMIQQYAPSFRDAGVSASQLVAVIHNSEGGIFTDQNMNAIVMGIRNIRLMTKQTSEALAKLGIDGQEMARKMSDGSMSVFDALRQVAEKLEHCEAGSQTAGEVMQSVFGRQGTAAGTNLAKAISTLNTNLEQTKTQTGEVGKALADLQTANENLNASLRETFSYDGWDEMATGIKTQLINALADVIEKLGKIKGLLWGITPGQARKEKFGITGVPEEVKNDLRALQQADESERENVFNRIRNKYSKRVTAATNDMANWRHWQEVNEQSSNWQGVPFVRKALDRWQYSNGVRTATSRMEAEQQVMQLFLDKAAEIMNPTAAPDIVRNPKYSNTTTTASGKSDAEQAQEKVNQAQTDYQQALEQAALELEAGTISQAEAKRKELQAAEALWKSIGDAREKYDSSEFAEAQKKAADSVVALGGEVNRLADEERAAQEAARQMKQAQERMAQALNEATAAFNANDLKGYIFAMNKVGGNYMQGMTAGAFSYTQNNMAAFRQNLSERLAGTQLGSTEFNALNAQLIDATTLANLMQEAVSRGIDIAEFMPQDLWMKIFGNNPGDFITPEQWQSVVDKFNEYAKDNPIKLDVATGGVSSQKTVGKEAKVNLGEMVNNVQTITRSLQDLGVDIPEGFTKVVAIMQITNTILHAIQAMSSLGTGMQAGGSLLSGIPILGPIFSLFGGLFNNGGVVHAANGFGGMVPGNYLSGDKVPALLNSGETVLTRAQTGNLAAQLDGMSPVMRSALAVIESDQIKILLQNGAQAKGQTLSSYLNL